MKKIVLGSIIVTASLFAFPGMQGMGMGSGMIGKPLKNLKNNTVLAIVDGKKITVQDINYYLQGITGDKRIKVQELPAQHIKKFVKDYIQTLELYNKKAKSIEKTPQFKAAEMKLAVDMWLKNRLASIKISDQEAKEFYEKNKDIYFRATPQIKARHILVKSKEEAIKLINELKGLKGKALEEKFAELAKKYSVGPSKVNGGELGWFNPKQMVPEFAKAAESLKPGQITLKPVHTRFGWHIILVEGKKSNNYMPFNQVKPQIIAYLKRLKLQQELKKIQDSYKIKYTIPTN